MVNGLTIEERLAHAQLMVAVASVDGELVQEELVMIESLMGKSMLHPEMRVDVRNTLNHPLEIDKCMEILSNSGQKMALRDAVWFQLVMENMIKKKFGLSKKLLKSQKLIPKHSPKFISG